MHGCLTLSNNHQGEKLMWNGEMRTLILIKKAMICSKEVWCIMACLFAFWFIMLIYSFPFCRLYCLSSMSKYFARCHQDAASTAPLIIKKSLHFFIFYLKNSQYFFFLIEYKFYKTTVELHYFHIISIFAKFQGNQRLIAISSVNCLYSSFYSLK